MFWKRKEKTIRHTVSIERSSGNFIQSDNFKVELPEAWTVENVGNRAQGKTGNDDVLIVSSYLFDGEEAYLPKARKTVKDSILDSMLSASEHEQLKVDLEIHTIHSSEGFEMSKMSCSTLDSTVFFNQYAIVGLKVGVLVTYEGPNEYLPRADELELCLKDIWWKDSDSMFSGFLNTLIQHTLCALQRVRFIRDNPKVEFPLSIYFLIRFIHWDR